MQPEVNEEIETHEIEMTEAGGMSIEEVEMETIYPDYDAAIDRNSLYVGRNFRNNLAALFAKYRVSREFGNNLLKLLRTSYSEVHGNLPLDMANLAEPPLLDSKKIVGEILSQLKPALDKLLAAQSNNDEHVRMMGRRLKTLEEKLNGNSSMRSSIIPVDCNISTNTVQASITLASRTCDLLKFEETLMDPAEKQRIMDDMELEYYEPSMHMSKYVNRIMKRWILPHNVAKHYSYNGQAKNKNSFSQYTNIIRFINDLVRRKFDVEFAAIKAVIMNYLKNAPRYVSKKRGIKKKEGYNKSNGSNCSGKIESEDYERIAQEAPEATETIIF